jgi:PAS domain S-box-containing protein
MAARSSAYSWSLSDPRERTPEVNRAPPRRLLVVEDDADFAESLAHVLNLRGFEMRLIRDPTALAETLATFPADVALVDVRLGPYSGLDLLGELAERRPGILTVVMTAHGVVDTAVQALRIGAYDYLSKPFDQTELFATLDRCFERVELQRARIEADAARGKIEARLRALVSNSLDVVAVSDVAGNLKFVSPSVLTLLGHGPIRTSTRNVFDFIHPEDREKARLALAECAEARRSEVQTVELRIRHRDGSWRWFEAVARGLLADPSIAGVLVCARDVTQRKAMEEQLRQAQKLEIVGQLTGGVAHDFNNLLAVILGSVELLKRSLSGQNDLLELADEAAQAAERGATLIRRLLSFSRIQPLVPRALDLNGLVKQTAVLLGRLLGERIRLETTLDGELWTCRADATQLETALLNLAINARDAMPDGGRLLIGTRNVFLDGNLEVPSDRGQPHVCVFVSDTGSGIPEDIRAHIFEPFFSTKEPGRGTGLGLSMVRGFVQQSNGQISVTSASASGTTFCLYFPRIVQPAVTRSGGPEAIPRAKGESVLLVEDDSGLRALVRQMLEEFGYRVEVAGAGPAALALLQAGYRPDILITDVVLPQDPSGFELAAQVITMLPGVKVLFTSAYAEDHIAKRPAAVATAPLLPKPFRPGDLAKYVRRVLES